MMEKPDNQQPQQAATQQFAMIWNYNAHVEQQNNYYGACPQPVSPQPPSASPLSREVLGQAIKQVEKYFWAQSSYAVIFCAVRDYYGYADNATLFENDIRSMASVLGLQFACPPNTISSAMHNNPYLKLHVSKWESRGVKPRSIFLANAFVEAVKTLSGEP